MENLKVGDKYFIDRLGLKTHDSFVGNDSIEKNMGMATITITKVNQKSFRADYEEFNPLYKELPKSWIKYDEKLMYNMAMDKLAGILFEGGYHNTLGLKTYDLLSDEEKSIISEKIKELAKNHASMVYHSKIRQFNKRIKDSYSWRGVNYKEMGNENN